MNPRIRELAEEAGYTPLEPRAFADDLQDIFLQKFAELIVGECANVVSAGIGNATDWDSSYWDQACENRAQAIKKHFGVDG